MAKEESKAGTTAKKTPAGAEATVSPERLEQLKRMGYTGELHEVKYKSSSTGQEVVLTLDSLLRLVSYKSFLPSEDDIVNTLNWCKKMQLDPYLNECYFIKGDGDNGRQPMKRVISKDYYFKKADAQDGYDGIEAGVIIKRKAGAVEEVAGTFKMDDDILLGGWAVVYRRDRSHPVTAKVSLTEYMQNTPKWKAQPATMIAKIAKVAALREAFPGVFSQMYIEEELADDEKRVSVVGKRFAPTVGKAVEGAQVPAASPAGDPQPGGAGTDGGEAAGEGAQRTHAEPAPEGGRTEAGATGADGIDYEMPKPTGGPGAGEPGRKVAGIKLPPILKPDTDGPKEPGF